MNAPIPASQELAAEASGFLAGVQSFKVSTPAQYEDAGAKLKAIKALRQKIADTFDSHIKRAHEAHKALVKEKSDAEQPLSAAEMLIKRALLAYQQEEEKKRREEQARLEEAARKEREKLEKQAAKAEEKGKTERAAELQAQAATVAAPVVAVVTPKVAGISTRSTWRAEVSDKTRLIEAAAGGRRVIGNPDYKGAERRTHNRVPQAALEPDTTFLNQQARSLKNELTYPGVRVVEDKGIASRSA